ncbi:MAG: FHA domain-containing protein [Deltaproteobacteria bacterium]|nr:FHA domain-containing protein [Deltaproteobacteria bacterium]
MAVLIFKGSNRQPVLIEQQKIIIGRSVEAEVIIDLPSVSRRHASVERAVNGYILQDLGSKRGTYLNGYKIDAPQILQNGDEIKVETVELLVEGISAWEFEQETIVDTHVINKLSELRERRTPNEVEIKNNESENVFVYEQAPTIFPQDGTTNQRPDNAGIDLPSDPSIPESDKATVKIASTPSHDDAVVEKEQAADDSDVHMSIESEANATSESDEPVSDVPPVEASEGTAISSAQTTNPGVATPTKVYRSPQVEGVQTGANAPNPLPAEKDEAIAEKSSQDGEDVVLEVGRSDTSEGYEVHEDANPDVVAASESNIIEQQEANARNDTAAPLEQAGDPSPASELKETDEPQEVDATSTHVKVPTDVSIRVENSELPNEREGATELHSFSSSVDEVTGTDRHAAGSVEQDATDTGDATIVRPRAKSAGLPTMVGQDAETSRSARLLIFHNGDQVGEFVLQQDHILIGRGEDIDCRLDSHFVSRKHVEIKKFGNEYYVENLSSRNKMFVNGRESEKANLSSFDVIGICDVSIMFVEPAATITGRQIKKKLSRAVPISAGMRIARLLILGLALLFSGILITVIAEQKPSDEDVVGQPVAAESSVDAVEELSERVENAINERDWTSALSILEAYPGVLENEGDLLATVKKEQENRILFVNMGDAVDRKSWKKAILYSEDLPSDSVYYVMMQDLLQKKGKSYIEETMKSANELARKKAKYSQALSAVSLVLRLDPDHEDAKKLYERLSRSLNKAKSAGSGRKAGKKAATAGVEDRSVTSIEQALAKYSSGDFSGATAMLFTSLNDISKSEAERNRAKRLYSQIAGIDRYYNSGLAARNGGQMTKAVNAWERALGMARSIPGTGLPVEIATMRRWIVDYYNQRAAEFARQNNVSASVSMYKRSLLYDSGNTTAVNGLAKYASQAADSYKRGVALAATPDGCPSAILLFQNAVDLTATSSDVHQKALKGIADCH